MNTHAFGPHAGIICLAAITNLFMTAIACSQNDDQKIPTPSELTDQMIAAVDPCAGNPNEAVCLCALEFPPVSFDTKTVFHLSTEDSFAPYDLATGRTLMNLVRANVVAIKPDSTAKQEVRLYVNPPATPDAEDTLRDLVHTNPSFKSLKLVDTLELPRHLGGAPDRMFGSIWWHEGLKALIITFRGTQTPFEFHLDTLVSTQRKIPLAPAIGTSLNVSNGFGIGYLMMRDRIMNAAETHKDQMKLLYVAGHSLGGAIAAITTADLASRYDTPNVIGYTFGQPRVFDPLSSNVVDMLQCFDQIMTLWRVVNASDPVPTAPPAATSGDGVKFKHTTGSVIYCSDPSSKPGKNAAWNHHFYYDGYFSEDAARPNAIIHPEI